MNAYMNQYQNNQVQTASPEQILIQLYDGAIRFVRQAKLAFAEDRKTDKAKAISKTVAIVAAFSNTLDREVGGEIAEDLSRLYDFMLRELSEANSTNDAGKLEPVEKILLDLREAFVGAVEINRQNAPQEQSSQYTPSPQSSQYAQSKPASPQSSQNIQPPATASTRTFSASC